MNVSAAFERYKYQLAEQNQKMKVTRDQCKENNSHFLNLVMSPGDEYDDSPCKELGQREGTQNMGTYELNAIK